MWIDLSSPWWACLDEAWVADGAGSMPIGVLVVDTERKIQPAGVEFSEFFIEKNGFLKCLGIN